MDNLAKPRSRRRLLNAISVGLVAFGLVAGSIGSAVPAMAGPTGLDLGPNVKLTGKAPTGYQLTVRHEAPPGVSQAYLFGEWSFSDPALVTGTGTGERKLGDEWEVGDIPGPDDRWISVPMELGADGVWTYTMALPPGTYSYGFTYDCQNRESGCVRHSDPANEPWSNLPAQASSGLPIQDMSQVYVPKATGFATTAKTYLAPVAASDEGTLTWLRVDSPTSTAPVGHRLVGVYLPPNYDPNRAEPYPTLYVTHGSGGNSTDWFSQGQVQVVVDNAIADGAAQEMVVVSSDNTGIPNGVVGFADELALRTVPAVEANFNVSRDSELRAFAGYSAGSARSTAVLMNYGTEFNYFGIWSRRDAFVEPTASEWANMKSPRAILLTCGISDYNGSGVSGLERWTIRRDNYIAGGMTNIIASCSPGVHGWDVWRGNLNEFVREIAFKGANGIGGAGSTAALTAVTAAAKAVSPVGLTTDSVKALTDAVAAAEVVLADSRSSQSVIDAALGAIQTALAGLKSVDNSATAARTALDVSVASASSLQASSYSSASWAALQSALAKAKALPASASAAQIQAAATSLSKAIVGLKPIWAVQVKAAQKSVVLVKGKSITIPAYAYNSDRSSAKVSWQSSATSVAKVSSTGTITAKKAGKATITIKSGLKKTTIKVSVVSKKPSAKVRKVTAKLPKSLKIGSVYDITAAYSSVKASSVRVTFSSSAKSVLTVDKAGRMTAVKAGTAKITVKAGGASKTYKVKVTK